jgi:hypothetical protein
MPTSPLFTKGEENTIGLGLQFSFATCDIPENPFLQMKNLQLTCYLS